MGLDQGRSDVVTPEAVRVMIDIAGLGSRMIAIIIDSAIQFVLFIALGFSFAGIGLEGVALAAAAAASFFLLFWGYFFLFEGLWNGRTPGKRAQRIRVIRVDGQPAGWIQAALRNLVRIIDLLPMAYTLGALSILLTKRSQRLGDLTAGTIVVREQSAPAPSPLSLAPEAMVASGTLDTSALTETEYSLIRSFLERRAALVALSRDQLAAQLATMVRPKVGGTASWTASDEALLEAVAASYRSRSRSTDIWELPPPPRS